MPDPWLDVTVVVLTLNEEHNLDRCLASVAPVGQIVVVDSGSTDQTRAVAERHGALWIEHPWRGFAAGRQCGAAAVRCQFTLYLDADEQVTHTLREEIARRLAGPQAANAFYILRRRSRFLGREILHGDWQNDWVARLVPTGKGTWTGLEPHPSLEAPDLVPCHCDAVLAHEPYRDVAVFRAKIESYARTWAEGAARQGVRGSVAGGAARASWRFLRGYILRLGFIDGRAGYIIAAQNARMVFLKYFFLSKLRGRAQDPPPCR